MTTIPLLPPSPDYTPREKFSPSALSAARRCRAYWGFRYIEGWKERELTWAEIEAGADHLPRERGKALGKAIHAKLEAYYWPLLWHAPLVWLGEVDWTDEPGRRALAMLAYLPRLDEILEIEVEAPIAIDVQRIRQCAEPPEFHGFRDLTVRITAAAVARLQLPPSPQNRYTFDYKSTKDWKWQKTPEVLLDDEQGVLYPLHTMHAHDLDAHVCVWVYSHTQCATPTARTTVFVQQRDRAERLAEELVVLAVDLRADMRSGIRANDLPKDTSQCPAFGGCPYHPSADGPCVPGRYSLGAAIAAQEAARESQPKEESTFMGKFADQIAAAAATTAPEPTTVAQPLAAEPAPEPTQAAPPVTAAEPPPKPAKAGKGKSPAAAIANGETPEFRYSLAGVVDNARLPADLAATLAERLQSVGLL